MDAAFGRCRSNQPLSTRLDPLSGQLGPRDCYVFSSTWPGFQNAAVSTAAHHLPSVSPITECPFCHPQKGGLASCDPTCELHLETLLPPGCNSGHRFLLQSDPISTPSLGNSSRFLRYQWHVFVCVDPAQPLFNLTEGAGAGREGCGVPSLCKLCSQPCLRFPGIF